MMDRRPLNPFEQQCYDLFLQGCTVKDVNRRLKVRMDCIVNARYKIMEKGYTLPKLETPSTELPDDIELTKEIMKAMNEKYNRKKLTDEERQEIIEYRKDHTVNQTVEKFRRTAQTIANVCKAAKQAENPAPEVPESEPKETPAAEPEHDPARIPPILLAAVNDKIEELRNRIVEHEYELVKAKQDLAELIRWEEEHNAD